MSDRPYKDASEKYSSKVKELVAKLSSRPPIPKRHREHLENMISDIHRFITEGGDIEKLNLKSKDPSQRLDLSWLASADELCKEYDVLFKMNEKLTSEETSILRIEGRLNRRALLYRFFTTLAIGFGVLLTYWMGQKLGVALPMMRLL